MQGDGGAAVHPLEAGGHPRSYTQGPGQRLGDTGTVCLHETPQQPGSMERLMNKHCFIRSFHEVKRIADTGLIGNKKTKKNIKKAKEA